MLRHVELREVIGSNVKRYRKAAGLTQPALGQLCGLHKNTILNIEKGGTESVQLESLEAIARALRIDVDELFRAPVSEGDLPELVNRYRSSPWAQIDKPSDDELGATLRRHSRSTIDCVFLLTGKSQAIRIAGVPREGRHASNRIVR